MRRFTRPAVSTGLSAAMLAFAGAASADTLDLIFLRTNVGQLVRVESDSFNGHIFAGELLHTFRDPDRVMPATTGDMFHNRTLVTYCIDIAQNLGEGHAVPYTPVAALGVNNGNGPDRSLAGVGQGSTSVAAANALVSVFGVITDTMAALRASGASGGTLNAAAAAAQLALWEVASDYDSGTLDLSGGSFRATGPFGASLSPAVTNFAGTMIGQGLYGSLSFSYEGESFIGGSSAAAVLFLSPDRQDQITAMPAGSALPAVPTPTAAAMGLLGLGAVAARRRRA